VKAGGIFLLFYIPLIICPENCSGIGFNLTRKLQWYWTYLDLSVVSAQQIQRGASILFS